MYTNLTPCPSPWEGEGSKKLNLKILLHGKERDLG